MACTHFQFLGDAAFAGLVVANHGETIALSVAGFTRALAVIQMWFAGPKRTAGLVGANLTV
jgi:hypothetical protein